MISTIGFIRDNGELGVSPVSHYRVNMPLRGLSTRSDFGVEILSQNDVAHLINQYGPMADRYLQGRDIYVISRLMRRDGLQRFLDAIHEKGGVCIFDTDDDLTDEYRELGQGEEFLGTMKHMDFVTVSTPFLAKRMERHLGYKPAIIPNRVNFDWFARKSLSAKKENDGLTIGFIGTASHYDDWVYPMEALHRLSKERDITIVCAGYQPDYLEDAVLFDFVPYKEYPGLMRQFDIVCCSLDDQDMFNKSKSAIKAIEAMASARMIGDTTGGAVPVCTDMPVYRRVVNGKNGVLVSNDGWYDVLLHLIDNPNKRREISLYGHSWARKNRDMKDGVNHIARIYKSVRRRYAKNH